MSPERKAPNADGSSSDILGLFGDKLNVKARAGVQAMQKHLKPEIVQNLLEVIDYNIHVINPQILIDLLNTTKQPLVTILAIDEFSNYMFSINNAFHHNIVEGQSYAQIYLDNFFMYPSDVVGFIPQTKITKQQFLTELTRIFNFFVKHKEYDGDLLKITHADKGDDVKYNAEIDRLKKNNEPDEVLRFVDKGFDRSINTINMLLDAREKQKNRKNLVRQYFSFEPWQEDQDLKKARLDYFMRRLEERCQKKGILHEMIDGKYTRITTKMLKDYYKNIINLYRGGDMSDEDFIELIPRIEQLFKKSKYNRKKYVGYIRQAVEEIKSDITQKSQKK